MKGYVRAAILLAATSGLATLSLNAIAQEPATTGSQQQPTAQQPNDMQNSASQPMSGTIVKEKGKLVLKDSATGTSYKLDDQDKAKQFEGKQVKVTGKLDTTTNQIKVENIEPAQQ